MTGFPNLQLASGIGWHSGQRLFGLTYGNGKALTRAVTTEGTWDYVLVGTMPNSKITYSQLDRLQRPTSVIHQGPGFSTRTEQYEYDGRGRLARAVVPGLDLGFGGQDSVTYRFTGPPDHLQYYTLDDRTQRNWYSAGGSLTTNEALASGLVSETYVADAADGSTKAGVVASNDHLVWLKMGPTDSGSSTCYDYDASGNLIWEATTNSTGKTQASQACPTPPASGYGHFWCYDYDDWGRLAKISEVTNLQQGCTPSNKVLWVQFGYDWKGRRVSMLNGAANPAGTNYYYDSADSMIAEVTARKISRGGWNESVAKYHHYLAGQLLAREDFVSGHPVYYVHSDFLGTPQRMTNSTGAVVWAARYEPFGEVQLNEDVDGNGVLVENRWRFPGQLDDRLKNGIAGVGPYYNYHRYYDPAIGAYTQADPLLAQGAAVHPYAYALGNPLSFIDPSGLLVELRCEQLRPGLKHCYVRTACKDQCPSYDKVYELGARRGGGFTLENDFYAPNEAKYRKSPQVIDSWSSPDCSLEDCIKNQFERTWKGRTRLPYRNPGGPNCNTFASNLLTRCGIITFFPDDAYGAPTGVFSPVCR